MHTTCIVEAEFTLQAVKLIVKHRKCCICLLRRGRAICRPHILHAIAMVCFINGVQCWGRIFEKVTPFTPRKHCGAGGRVRRTYEVWHLNRRTEDPMNGQTDYCQQTLVSGVNIKILAFWLPHTGRCITLICHAWKRYWKSFSDSVLQYCHQSLWNLQVIQSYIHTTRLLD